MKYLTTIMMGLFLFSGISNAQVTKSKETVKSKTIIKTNPELQHEVDKSKMLKKHINLIYPAKTDKNVAVDASLKWEVSNKSNNGSNYQKPPSPRFDVYFGTDPNPAKVSSGQIERSYTPTLDYNNTYYWKVEITGSKEEIDKSVIYSFKTKPFIQWDDDKFGTFTDPRDDKSYKVLKIGEQVWFAENLAYLPKITPYTPYMSDKYYGSGIRDHYVYDYKGNSIEEAKSTYNYKTYGVLYDWQAATNRNSTTSESNPSGVKGACPSGWHVPSYGEWEELMSAVANNGEVQHKMIGKALASNTIWETSGGKSDNVAYRSTNNSTGFNALPSGWGEIHSSNNGTYIEHKEIGNWTMFWTSSKARYENEGQWLRTSYSILKSRGDVTVHERKVSEALSVRCVKD